VGRKRHIAVDADAPPIVGLFVTMKTERCKGSKRRLATICA
jgi:hypothetical protein